MWPRRWERPGTLLSLGFMRAPSEALTGAVAMLVTWRIGRVFTHTLDTANDFWAVYRNLICVCKNKKISCNTSCDTWRNCAAIWSIALVGVFFPPSFFFFFESLISLSACVAASPPHLSRSVYVFLLNIHVYGVMNDAFADVSPAPHEQRDGCFSAWRLRAIWKCTSELLFMNAG